MRRFFLLLLSFILLLASCTPGAAPQPPTLTVQDTPMPTMPTLPINPAAEDWLNTLTLEQKIGQTMIIGFDGTTADPDLLRMVREYHIGGVILFARNVQSPAQVAGLVNDLQEAARQSGHPGLFIAIDQEGGIVARLTEDKGFTEFPSAMAITATGDPQNAYRMAAAMAAEMRAVGVNVDFAPDLDVNNNPDNPIIGIRSFSADPQEAAQYGVAFLQGLQENGVLAFGKHFPGHGDTSVDSHIDLPLVPHDRARLDEIELVPFRAAIAADVAGIMTAHVTFPAIDPTPGLPATLSRPALTGLLREELGYDGLIVTDSLEMGALAANGYPPEKGAVLALAAGADLLLFNRDHAMHRQAFANLLQAVKEGEISENQLDDSVRRILQAKQTYQILNPAPLPLAGVTEDVQTATNLALSRALALSSITILRDPQHSLPLPAQAPRLIVEPANLRGLLTPWGGTIFQTDTNPTDEQIANLLHAAQDGRAVILPLYNLKANPNLLVLAQKLTETPAKPIFILYRNPYEADLLPANAAVLLTYGMNPPYRETLLKRMLSAE